MQISFSNTNKKYKLQYWRWQETRAVRNETERQLRHMRSDSLNNPLYVKVSWFFCCSDDLFVLFGISRSWLEGFLCHLVLIRSKTERQSLQCTSKLHVNKVYCSRNFSNKIGDWNRRTIYSGTFLWPWHRASCFIDFRFKEVLEVKLVFVGNFLVCWDCL